jgi:ubiquinone/menaquinone biosynthesis C-methylase UbiE
MAFGMGHDLVQKRDAELSLKEARRVLKAEGSLAILEFKQIDGPGPPIHVRLTPNVHPSLIGVSLPFFY